MVPIWAHKRHNAQNFKIYSIVPKSKIGSHHQNLSKKILKTRGGRSSRDARGRNQDGESVDDLLKTLRVAAISREDARRNASCLNLEPTKFVILRIFWTKFGDFVKIWILANLWNLKSLTLAKIKILDP